MMNTNNKYYSPDDSDDSTGGNLSEGTQADETLVTDVHEKDWRGEDDKTTAGHLTNTKLDAKGEGGDQANVRGGDSTILGAGGTAGGLSGDGERTDEYDAAVMGLDD